MKVLSVGTDRSLFVAGSAARLRAEAYAQRFGELQVVVFSLKRHNLQPVHANHLHLYPTDSRFKFAYLFDAVGLLRRLPGEVVTAQDPFESGLAAVFGRRGRPLHIQLHTDPFSPAFWQSPLNVLRLVLMRFVLARAARVRAVSHRMKEELKKRYPHLPVSALPIFVDVERFRVVERALHPRFSPALLWVGRFEWEKNPGLALCAFAAVAKKHPNAGFVMLGTGSLERRLKSLARRFGVEGRVEFPGWQDPAAYLAQADLFLVTSRYEGYGRQIIEALAAGVPVLSTDVGIANETGAVIAAPENFAHLLATLLTTGTGRGVLAQYPYKNFEEYSAAYCADIESVR